MIGFIVLGLLREQEDESNSNAQANGKRKMQCSNRTALSLSVLSNIIFFSKEFAFAIYCKRISLKYVIFFISVQNQNQQSEYPQTSQENGEWTPCDTTCGNGYQHLMTEFGAIVQSRLCTLGTCDIGKCKLIFLSFC